MLSDRLRYQPLQRAHLEDFHRLVQDPHVRRYLMDGRLLPRDWSEARIRESQELVERRGVGLWLVHDRVTLELVGFCGFLRIPETLPDPQLTYAMFERFTGRGYGTEMVRAAITQARRQPGFDDIVAMVDEVNAASLRLLEKVGFQRIETQRGNFGRMFVMRLGGAADDARARTPR